MSRSLAAMGALASALFAATAPGMAGASAPSTCVTCHLDEAMLVRNLAVSVARRSALQSGAG